MNVRALRIAQLAALAGAMTPGLTALSELADPRPHETNPNSRHYAAFVQPVEPLKTKPRKSKTHRKLASAKARRKK